MQYWNAVTFETEKSWHIQRNLPYEQKELLLGRTKQTTRGREIALFPWIA